MDFTVAMLNAEQADRRQDQWHRCRLAENRGGQVALRDVDEDALAQLDLLKVLRVGAQRLLGVRAAVRIIEKCLWYPALVPLPQIFDSGNVLHGRFPLSSISQVSCRCSVIQHRSTAGQIAEQKTGRAVLGLFFVMASSLT